MDIRDYIKKEGYYLGTVVGNSMWPILRERKDSVLIVPIINRLVKKYDIVLFEVNNNLVLHRIINLDSQVIITRGDNSHRIERLHYNNLIGRLKGFYRGNKYVDSESRLFVVYSWLIVRLNFIIRIKDKWCKKNRAH